MRPQNRWNEIDLETEKKSYYETKMKREKMSKNSGASYIFLKHVHFCT